MIPILPLAAVGAAVLAFSAPSGASVIDHSGDNADSPTGPIDMGTGNDDWSSPVNHELLDGPTVTDTANATTDNAIADTTPSGSPQGNLDAFLSAIRVAESHDNYGALVGGGTFADFSHHPATGPNPWPGIVTKWGPTHAAGAYQFQPGTWREAAAACGLTDFSPESQDTAAVFLITRRGALEAVQSGDLKTAYAKLRTEWQSIALRGSSFYTPLFAQAGGITIGAQA